MSFQHMRILASTDISSHHKVLGRYRGKVAKGIYRCGKGVLITGGLKGPLSFAVTELTLELSTGFVKGAAGSAVETVIGYVSVVGFVRWVYKAANVGRMKAYARLGYNILGLPITLYCKGISKGFDILQISNLEEKWFGEKVYIFDDNRLWLEKNFTLNNAFDVLREENES